MDGRNKPGRTPRTVRQTGIIDHEEAITHLQVMHTWASFAREKELYELFDRTVLERIEQWTGEIIRMLKAEEDDGK